MRLLKDLHALNYFSLSFSGGPGVAQGFKATAQKRLDGEMGEISEKYRKALEYKISMYVLITFLIYTFSLCLPHVLAFLFISRAWRASVRVEWGERDRES
jgi:hypothetical protein